MPGGNLLIKARRHAGTQSTPLVRLHGVGHHLSRRSMAMLLWNTASDRIDVTVKAVIIPVGGTRRKRVVQGVEHRKTGEEGGGCSRKRMICPRWRYTRARGNNAAQDAAMTRSILTCDTPCEAGGGER